MIQRIFLLALILVAGLVPSPAVSAMDSVSVSATVAPARLVYADVNGDLLKVVGNTDQNIEPTVVGGDWNIHLQRQYEQLLAANGGFLEAGKTYLPPESKLPAPDSLRLGFY